jgi:hypothetical protein
VKKHYNNLFNFMKKTLLLFVAVTQALIFSDAQAYSSSDYDPQYLPHNFEEAEDARLCRDAVKAFDSDYDALTKSYTENLTEVILSSGVQGSVNNVNAWLEANEFYYSNIFRECIAEDIKKEEAEDRKRASERFEQEQLEKLQKATEECDMGYFDGLSNSKKMETYDVRMACKEKLSSEVNEVMQVDPIVTIPAPRPIQADPVVTRYVPTPVQIPEPSVVPEIVENIQDEEEIPAQDQDSIASTTEATTTEDVIAVTQAELDRMVEERVAAAVEETASESVPKKLSVFKRIINFFTGWF